MVSGPTAMWRAGRAGPPAHRGAVLRALLRQRRRLLLAGVAIALGVGYLAGALGLLDRIGAGLDELATASADDADLVIEGDIAYESSLEQVRRLVPSGLADAVEGNPAVASASHRLEDIAVVVGADGRPVVTPGLSEQPLGVNWPEDPSISNLDVVEGEPPAADGEVALDARSAEAAGARVGDQVTVAGKGKVGDYTVSGIVDTAAAGPSEGASLVVFTTDEARVVFDRELDDNRIALRLVEGADPDTVAAELSAGLGAGVVVVDNETAALHAQEGLTRSFTLVRALVTGFGVLALAVGMLTVANSLSLLHAQRRHLFATFRLVGASVRQLRRAAFTEAALLAVAASVVGIPLGLLLAWAIEAALGSLGTSVPTAGPALTVRAALVAVGVGVVATMLAAWRPVTHACRVPPVEALRESVETRPRRFSVVVAALGRGLVLAVAAGGVAVLAGATPAVVAMAAVATCAVVVLLGLLPAGLARTVAGVMSAVPFRPRPLRRVAARDAARNPRRTAATTAAVLLAAAVVSGLAVFLQSFTVSVEGAVDDLVVADLVVDSETFTRGGLPADLVRQLGFVDGVQESSGWQLGRGSIGEVGIRLTGLDGPSALDVVDPDFEGTPPDGLDGSSAWISTGLADRLGLAIGSELPVLFTSGGYESLDVTGVYRSGEALLGDVVTDREVLLRQVPATVDLAALLDTDGSAQAEAAVAELAASYGITAVLSPDEFVDQRADLLRGFQRVVQWMLLFTLLQALVGVVNTLVLSVGERRREFGLLRVSGASRRQVLSMVLFEGTALASVGTALGLAVGLGGAALAVWALGSLGLGTFSVPLLAVFVIAVAAVGVGIAAAWLPARMAAAVPPLDAVVDSGVEFTAPATAAAPEPRAPAPRPVPRAIPPVVPSATGPTLPPPFDPSRLPPPAVPVGGPPAVPAPAPVVQAPEEAAALAALYAAASGTDGAAAVVGASAPPVGIPPMAAPQPVEPVPAAPPAPAAVAAEDMLAECLLAEGVLAEGLPVEGVPAEGLPVEEDVVLGEIVADDDVPSPGDEVAGAPVAGGPVAEDAATESPKHPRGLRRPGLRGRKDRTGPAVPRRRPRRGAPSSAAEGWVSAAQATEAPTGPGAATEPSSEPVAPTPPGTNPLVGRLGPVSPVVLRRCLPALDATLASLAPGEEPGAAVVGRVRNWPAVVVRTERRLLVVVDRPGRMVVESLHPFATDVVLRPDGPGAASVLLFDRGRMLEVCDVGDAAAADTMVSRPALSG